MYSFSLAFWQEMDSILFVFCQGWCTLILVKDSAISSSKHTGKCFENVKQIYMRSVIKQLCMIYRFIEQLCMIYRFIEQLYVGTEGNNGAAKCQLETECYYDLMISSSILRKSI